MNAITIAVLIGIVAGLIDITPMVLMKLERSASISAFVHYFVLGLAIPFIDWGIPQWITGIIISVLSAIPIMIIVSSKDKKSIIPMSVFSVLLGAGIGLASEFFIG